MLSNEQILHYKQQGFLVLDHLVNTETLCKLKQQALTIVENWVDGSQSHIFTTKDNNRSGDNYFLQSAEKIRCFFEEEAFGENGDLVQQRSLCINKIGHALHAIDPVFNAFTHQSIFGDIAAELGIQQPQVR